VTKKNRVPIPPEIAAEVLFASHSTCCKCNQPGKRVQLHHIDSDPANNVPENLAVLCFGCHDETLIRGGFARTLDAAQVRRYREDWTKRVRQRRCDADRLAVAAMVTTPPEPTPKPIVGTLNVTLADAVTVDASVSVVSRDLPLRAVPIVALVSQLPAVRRAAYVAAQPRWATGVTADAVEASYEVIYVLEEVLGSLANYYPKGHFHPDDPGHYISEVIADRFHWHRHREQPLGDGNHGTIVYPMIAAAVLADVEQMIEQMVQSLTLDWSGESTFDFAKWLFEWRTTNA
jgi:hypothetical protein